MYLSGIAESNEVMEAEFPTGAYGFTFSTPGGDVVDSVVSLAGGDFPMQPVIIFKQGGGRIAFDTVDPNEELTITWPPFTEGGADPNGILDDLIFVAIDSCAVEDIVHVRDLHATILHLLGIDHERLDYEYRGLDLRLTGVEPARVMKEWIA